MPRKKSRRSRSSSRRPSRSRRPAVKRSKLYYVGGYVA